MKICMINIFYQPYMVGGAEEYVKKITNYLRDSGEEMAIITSQPYNEFTSLTASMKVEENIKIYRFYPLNLYFRLNASTKSSFLRLHWRIIDLFNFHSYFIIKKILNEEKPDVVHTHNLRGLSAGATFRAINDLNLPLVHTCHDYSIFCPYSSLICPLWKGNICEYPKFPCKIYRGVKRKILHSPEIVTSPSQFVLDKHIAAGFFEESKKIVLPLGIELENFNNVSKRNNDAENFNILYVGVLGKIKGVHVLIEAFKKMSQSNAKLHIIGDGYYASTLKELAKDDKRIKFYGKLPNEEVQKFYKEVDISVVPSIWYEAFGIVIQEAFRQGTPVIGSNIGGIPELIKDNYNGFLFEAGNVKQLKEILENIIETPGDLKELSKNAFESLKQYNMNKHIERLLKIYKEAIKINKDKKNRS